MYVALVFSCALCFGGGSINYYKILCIGSMLGQIMLKRIYVMMMATQSACPNKSDIMMTWPQSRKSVAFYICSTCTELFWETFLLCWIQYGSQSSHLFLLPLFCSPPSPNPQILKQLIHFCQEQDGAIAHGRAALGGPDRFVYWFACEWLCNVCFATVSDHDREKRDWSVLLEYNCSNQYLQKK